MALNIDRVAVTMDVGDTGADRAPRATTEEQLRAQIREIVIDVLRTELARARREA